MIVVCILTGDVVPFLIKDGVVVLNSTNPFFNEDNCIVTTWENYRKMIEDGMFNGKN